MPFLFEIISSDLYDSKTITNSIQALEEMLKYKSDSVNRSISLASVMLKSVIHRLLHPSYDLRIAVIKFLCSLTYLDGVETG